jgi:hypothetical protein
MNKEPSKDAQFTCVFSGSLQTRKTLGLEIAVGKKRGFEIGDVETYSSSSGCSKRKLAASSSFLSQAK